MKYALSHLKKGEYYIWSIRFGSYDTGGDTTATKQQKNYLREKSIKKTSMEKKVALGPQVHTGDVPGD